MSAVLAAVADGEGETGGHGVAPASSSPSMLSPQAVAALLQGERRSVRRRRTRRWEVLLQARLASRSSRVRHWTLVAERTAGRRTEARDAPAVHPPVRRPFGRPAAALFTGLLMVASFFTVTSILATADLAPLEAWLLPVALGPVYVLSTKTTVAAWLSAAPTDRRPSPAQRLTARLVGPALAVASLALVSGVALKSVAVGSSVPLRDEVGQLSSLLVFAGLMLGELAGSAALATRQHRPGARAYAALRDAHRWTAFRDEVAQWRRGVAERRAEASRRALAAYGSWKAGRARQAVATAWWRAAQHAAPGDRLLHRVDAGRISVGPP